MPKLAATMPKPASTPARNAPDSAGAGPSHQANANAAISEKTKLMPKTFAGCLPSGPFGGAPASRFQVAPNSLDEYHSPPSRKLDAAATITARKLMCIGRSPLKGLLRSPIYADRALGDESDRPRNGR